MGRSPLGFRSRKQGKYSCVYMLVKLPPFNHFQSKIISIRATYEEYTGDYCQVDKHLTSFPPFLLLALKKNTFSYPFLLTYLHQNTATLFKPRGLFQVEITCQKHAPNCTINNIKMQRAITVGWGHPDHPPPPFSRSLHSLELGRFAPSQVIFTAT